MKTRTNCFEACHNQIAKQFGSERYDIINRQFGLLTVSANDLESFMQTSSNIIVESAPFHPEMKVADELREFVTNLGKKCQERKNEGIALVMSVHGMTKSEFEQFQVNFMRQINTFNGVVRVQRLEMTAENQRFSPRVEIGDCGITDTVVRTLSMVPEIHWLEIDHPLVLHNRYAKSLCDAGQDGYVPLDDYNITGEGEVVGVTDTGIDMKHCFFYDPDVPAPFNKINHQHRKVVYYFTSLGDGLDEGEAHGTHVAGTVAGESYNNYGDYKKLSGMVHGAKIAFADIAKADGVLVAIPNLKDLFNNLATSGAKIFTNSWGTTQNVYEDKASKVDQFMWENPDSLVIFSAGNEGTDKNGNLVSKSVGAPSTNKNGISVGASLNSRESWKSIMQSNSISEVLGQDSLAYFSSQGPTADNRLKPDLTAPGYYIFSAKGKYNASSPHCEAQGLSGTSMAAPVVAGFATKVRQFYRHGYYPTGERNASNGFVPSGALIKATLIHSGQKLSYLVKQDNSWISLTQYPSAYQGYGRIQMNKVLNFGQSSRSPLTMFVKGGATPSQRHYVAFTTTGQLHAYNFTAGSHGTPIRVTFCYTDYFGSTSSNNAMINTVTLTIHSPSGTVLTPMTTPDTTQSNVQMIDIDSPVAGGVYTILIHAIALSRTPQPYAFVATGDLTYVNATSDPITTSHDSVNASLNYDTSVYLIVLAVLVCFLSVVLYHFYRLVKNSAMNNAANFREDSDFPYEYLDDEEQNKKQTVYQKYFQRKRNQKK